MKITLVAGARPNFMKIAPIIHAIKALNSNQLHYRLVHTGQHYDDRLSKIFFEQLNIPEADVNLGSGSGTQAEQTAKIMVEFEKDLIANPTDLVVVVGDVNSTMACTIVAKKLNTKVAHVEGGIRSFDMAMPEEINRMVTDSLADYFFTTSTVANENLKKTGVKEEQIFFVGNTMIDSLLRSFTKLKKPALFDELNLKEKDYTVLTMHRPSNVDDAEKFALMIYAIDKAASHPVIFPVHPRTQKKFEGLSRKPVHIKACEPLSYFEFIYLIKNSSLVVTDSGGVQEETTVMQIPCVTLRNNTERPETITVGTNEMIGEELSLLPSVFNKVKTQRWKKGNIPELWDGNAAKRIVECLLTLAV